MDGAGTQSRLKDPEKRVQAVDKGPSTRWPTRWGRKDTKKKLATWGTPGGAVNRRLFGGTCVGLSDSEEARIRREKK